MIYWCSAEFTVLDCGNFQVLIHFPWILKRFSWFPDTSQVFFNITWFTREDYPAFIRASPRRLERTKGDFKKLKTSTWDNVTEYNFPYSRFQGSILSNCPKKQRRCMASEEAVYCGTASLNQWWLLLLWGVAMNRKKRKHTNNDKCNLIK